MGKKTKIKVNEAYSMLNLTDNYYCPWRRITNWPRNIKLFFRAMRWRRQRAHYGFSESDLWNLDNYLSEMIATALHNFTNDLHSIPSRLYKGVHCEKDENDRFEAWKRTVEEVAKKWDALAEARSNPFDNLMGSQERMKQEAFDALSKIYFDLWD